MTQHKRSRTRRKANSNSNSGGGSGSNSGSSSGSSSGSNSGARSPSPRIGRETLSALGRSGDLSGLIKMTHEQIRDEKGPPVVPPTPRALPKLIVPGAATPPPAPEPVPMVNEEPEVDPLLPSPRAKFRDLTTPRSAVLAQALNRTFVSITSVTFSVSFFHLAVLWCCC
jgi:hypothetical protein